MEKKVWHGRGGGNGSGKGWRKRCDMVADDDKEDRGGMKGSGKECSEGEWQGVG